MEGEAKVEPIIIKNSRVPKLFSWFMPVAAVTIFPFIFIKGNGSEILIRHETIHFKQYMELLIVGFPILYVFDFLYGLCKYKSPLDAYRSIRLEREAFSNQLDDYYLRYRKPYSWRKYKL